MVVPLAASASPTELPAVNALLSVSHVHKSFGGVKAVNDVSLSVNHGEVVGLIGPNGSGKTTMLGIIAGFHRPDAGQILYRGEGTAGLATYSVASLGIVRTWQDPRLFEELTVHENIRLGELASKASARADNPFSINVLLDKFKLRDFASLRASSLSYGQQKLVSLARGLAACPTLLLMDEPMAGLSNAELNLLLEEITWMRHHCSVLIVDHAFGAMSTICDRMVVLHAGQKIFQGTPDEVARQPEVRKVYFGNDA